MADRLRIHRLTYMDVGVWAVVIGMIKLGPGAVEIARREARDGETHRAAQRSLRGAVLLTSAAPASPSTRSTT